MTTPAERRAALLDAAELLEALAYRGTYHGDDIKPVGHDVRKIAERVLLHYPTVPEIERGAGHVQPTDQEDQAAMTPITGKQLRFAIEHGLKVRCVLRPYDPSDSPENVVSGFEPAVSGYYVGSTDIEPDEYGDDDPVFEEGPGETFALYPLRGVDYGP